MQPADFVRPPQHRHLTPLRDDERVMPFGFSQGANRMRERQRWGKLKR